MNNSVSNEINELEVIDNERGYWFVRTDNGINFDTYYDNGFIGIGWNDITLEDLTKLSVKEVQGKIAKNNNYDLNLSKGKSKATGIYNKLIRFKNIKKGDVIMMPSYGSGRLAFGIVEDSNVYVELEKTGDCEYYKRKKVNWATAKNIKSLDSKFYEIKLTRHAISNVKAYENYIDRVISTFYFKANTGNFVFQVNKKNDINVTHLVELIGTIQSLISDINSYYDYNENVEESVIKLSLQSEGLFALMLPIGRSLATLGIMLSLASCGDNRTGTPEQQKFIENHKMELDTIAKQMNNLEIDKEKINKAFK